MYPADDRLAAALLHLALVPADRPLPLVLEQVAGLAADALGGRPALSVTVLGVDGGTTVGTSAQVAAELDQVQYRAGSGPCLEAVATGRMLVVEDTAHDPRWPELARAAAAAGLRSVLSVPFPTARPASGGLNVYLQLPVGAGGEPRERAELLARLAAARVADSHLVTRLSEQAVNLQQALDSRAVIDQAKGILVERFRLTPEQAFAALARVSNRTNTKLREVAERLVDTGEFPTA
ncbi:GAF and ANTAR domain-containing protein [Geodermatophilus nigrescens]|uniref:Response regulator receiver and ANTAR domain protein n=1 Tax=Geodermatophilus nigrescens TaxID=1070870 RepID=A0A1M5IIU9_9ACTN|nr:GAF and ANTAR domain-containing protein [Geodermatophilus nigrescens]SHG28232.1 response regulator receiver and ANTAR domain protein [Geodermatophilus nigrescens]